MPVVGLKTKCAFNKIIQCVALRRINDFGTHQFAEHFYKFVF